MDFVAVIDQVIALLRQRGRVAYRTLKRQFQLNDEALEDLKVELIKSQRLAADEDGDVLVWLGDAAVPPAPGAVAPALGPLPSPQEVALPQTAPSPAAPSTPEAERRQLTVLFCDLVDSTVLARQLDPEDLRAVVRAYQDTCAKVIARFEGHIAQYLGDGLLVYFGYPLAHEDDAQRAVRAGLGMVEALGQLNTRLRQEWGVALAVRLGIHTGLVVVGEVGGSTRQEQLALGETPNLAARLQGLAAPNTVVISAATLALLGGFFACQSLGASLLKGFAQPLDVYQVLAERMVRSRLEALGSTGLTPLVGRAQEAALLQERWAQVKEGLGQHGFVLWIALGTFMRGWVLAARSHERAGGQEQGEEGMAQMQQSLAALRAIPAEVFRPYGLALLAEARMQVGQRATGLTLLAEALALTHDKEERRWEAELYRLKGEGLLAHTTGHDPEAETCFRQALDIARHQEAKSLELRAAVSLSRLWQQQGKRAEARELLAPLYGWFTEGFGTADLQEAKALLEVLGG